ncbi:MAG: DUF2169 family type VI secretion system accessory protein [Undibacterium curvum]|uniref:DUF2169 family type VI secretion system accessory protein n=1 Tax=Undibacterium curvum TaxID=2762294 RepID=UPI003BE91645
MKIIKPLTLGILQKPYRFQGQDFLVISALGFFQLGQKNATRFLVENIQWQRIVPALPLGRPIDEVMPKTHSEVLVAGSAFAPGGKAVSEMQVRLCVGSIDKRLRVLGDRNWVYSLLPLYQISQPQSFTQMPLVYQRAFGAANHSGNLIGCGYTGQLLGPLFGKNHGAMPNIEYPETPVKSPLKQYAPAGFGPIDMSWSPRKEKHGTFNQDWLDHHAPGLAKDVDWSVFNTAPVDQWMPQHFSGGEAYRLEGMHPELSCIEGTLPNATVRAFVLQKDCAVEQAQSVRMQMDTVWFFPEQQLGVAIYHGQTPIQDIDGQDVQAIMLAYEAAGENKTLEHYQQVFALRMDAETAALHAFNESQLAPARSAEELSKRATLIEQETAARVAQQQAILDEMEQDFWAECGIDPLPGHIAPIANVPALPSISQHDLAEGDFDLSSVVAAAKAMAAQAQADGDARLADLKLQLADLPTPPAPPTTDMKAQQNAALELAAVPAYDLLPPDQQSAILPAELAELMSGLDIAQQDQSNSAERTRIHAALLQQAQQKRQARNAAPQPTAPAQAMSPDVASWLGEQVRQWQAGGACLAGRDLAGADLRNIDFSGADLRQIMLEQCLLDGANFSGADLSGAVLTGASINGTNFSHANLSNANLCLSHGKAACFANAQLSQSKAIDAVWPEANLQDADLSDCLALKIDLSQACLDRADCSRSTLLEARADHSSWQHAKLDQTILLKASLEQANFSGAQVHKAVFMDARLHASIWIKASLLRAYGGGKTDFSQADFSQAQASKCGWHGASFIAADFTDAQFLECDFGSCNLSDARLNMGLFSSSLFMNAKLCRVDAGQADFFRALGRKADFSDANLRGANLVQVDLTGAKLDGACLDQVRLDPQRRVA